MPEIASHDDNRATREAITFAIKNIKRGDRNSLLIMLFLMTISAAFQASSPLIIRLSVNMLSSKQISGATLAIFSYVIFIWVSRASRSCLTFYFGAFWRPLRTTISGWAFNQVLHLPNEINRSTGQLSHSIFDGVSGLRAIYSATILGIIPTLIHFIIFICIWISVMDAYLAIGVLVFLGFYAAVFAIGLNQTRSLQRQARLSDGELAAIGNDAIGARDIVKLFNMQPAVVNQVERSHDANQARWLAAFSKQNTSTQYATFVLGVCLGILLLTVGNNVLTGRASIGDFVMTNIFAFQLLIPVENSTQSIREVFHGLEGLKKLLTLTNSNSEAFSSDPKGDGKAYNPFDIHLDNVAFKINGRTLIDGANIRIREGETVAIVGQSGSGKSTLWKLIAGFYVPTSGKLSVGGDTIDYKNLKPFVKRISVVTQDNMLLNDTIANNIRMAFPGANDGEVRRAADLAGLGELVARSAEGLDSFVGERGERLSGGERQRVAIARALIRRPSMYIFDEFTSALDNRMAQDIMERVLDVTAGTTRLIISHRLSAAVAADSVLFVEAGRITTGTHDSLMLENSQYKQLWGFAD